MKVVKFDGTWINKFNQETIRLTGPNSSDEYILEYGFEGDAFKKKETIPIYISNEKHALLANSDRFGRVNIQIFNMDKFSIGKEVFERIERG